MVGRNPAEEEGMEAVISNIALAWNAPKDWSMGGGLIWLAGFALASVLLVILTPALTDRR